MKSLFYLLEVLSPSELEKAITAAKRPKDALLITEIIEAIRTQRYLSQKLTAEVRRVTGYSNVHFRKRCSMVMADILTSLSNRSYRRELMFLARRIELLPLFLSRTKQAIRRHKGDHSAYLLLSLSGYFYCVKYGSKYQDYFASELAIAAANADYSAQEYIDCIRLLSLLTSGVLSKSSRNKGDIQRELEDIRRQVHDAYARYKDTDDVFIRWFVLLSVVHYEIVFRVENGAREKLPLLRQTAHELESLGLFETLTSYVKRLEAILYAREGNRIASYRSLHSIIASDPLAVISSPSILTDILCEAVETEHITEASIVTAQYCSYHISEVRAHALLNVVITIIISSNEHRSELAPSIAHIFNLNKGATYRLKLDILVRLSETTAAFVSRDYQYTHRLCTRHRKYFEKRGLLASVTDGIDWPSLTKVYSVLDQCISLQTAGKNEKAAEIIRQRIALLTNSTSMIQIIERALLQAAVHSIDTIL
jgi:hypothetical protein